MEQPRKKERKAMRKIEFARSEYGQSNFYRGVYEHLLNNAEALAELNEANYNKKSKTLTIKQQEIILKHL